VRVRVRERKRGRNRDRVGKMKREIPGEGGR